MNDLDALKRSTDLVALLESYGIALKRRGQEYDGLCIAHSETNPSMQVYLKDGIQKWHCKSCGAGGTVIDAIMVLDGCDEITAIKRLQANGFHRETRMTKTTAPIKPAMNPWTHRIAPDEMPDMTTKDFGAPVATWRYNDAEGKCLGYIARYATSDGGKSYRPWTFGAYSENVSATWKPKTWTAGRRPLYGLDLLAQRKDAKVCIVEGEKAADAARTLLQAMVCITWPGGANGILSVDWSPLTGRDILLIPDADRTGVGHDAMIKVAGILLALGCKVRILDTSDQPDAWDLADAVADGWTPAQLGEWAKPRISALTSRELEQQRAEAEKKTMLSAQLNDAPEHKPVPGFDEDSSIYELPPLPDTPEFAEPYEPLTIDVQPTEIPDATAIKPAKTKRIKQHTQITEALAPEAAAFSDVHIAETWADGDGQDWLFCHGWECWMQWDNSRWAIDRRRAVTRIVSDQMKAATNWPEANQLSIKDRRALCSVAKIASVLKHASTLPTIARIPEDFDSNPYLLGTPDGTLDLKTGKLIGTTREHYITRQTAVAPKSGPMPQWNKVLDRCTRGDPEMRKYYQRWAGYLLTGDCREESFLFVHGAGNSGKSKFIDCLGDILGKADEGGYCATAKIEMLMESKIERHTEEIASLAGARMVRTSEPDEGARWNEALLKLITGRDTVSARRLYEKQFTFRPEFKLMVNGNFRPAFKSTGEEIFRRMHFVEFPESIPEAERIYNLPELLREEWPAILQWMVEGCIEWQRIGLSRPDRVKTATKEYLSEEDTLGRWIEECCTKGADRKVLAGEAYKSYSTFIQHVGEGVVSQKRFSQRMEARGYGRIKSGGFRYITGLEIAIAHAHGWTDREF
jgi:putative DNA primase/helicase